MLKKFLKKCWKTVEKMKKNINDMNKEDEQC